MVYYWDAAEYTSHSSKPKKLHIYPFMADVTWVKWPKDLSVQRRWTALISCERKDKIGKNVDLLNLARNSRICSHHFDREKISMDVLIFSQLHKWWSCLFCLEDWKITELQSPG